MPLAKWQVSDDFDASREAMLASVPPGREGMFHYSKADVRAVRDDGVIKKVELAFRRMPIPINLFFYHHPEPNYDPVLQMGRVDAAWVRETLGDRVAAQIDQWMSGDAINVIFSNNLSDNHPISLKSPWMIGHRIAHTITQGKKAPAMTRNEYLLGSMVEQFVKDLTGTAYGIGWEVYDRYSDIITRESLEILGTLLGKTLGTFRSAREGTLVQLSDWSAEMLTQWMLTGSIPFKPLPEMFDVYPLTEDPRKRLKAEIMVRKAPMRFAKACSDICENAKGHLWVM